MNDFVANNIITITASVLAFEVLMGMLSQHIAEKKGHSRRWFWAGFLGSLPGAVWAAGLPDETLRRELAAAASPRASAAPVVEVPRPAPPAREDAAIAAVISAAVASMGEREGKRFVMRSFRPAQQGSTAWNRAGRGGPPGA